MTDQQIPSETEEIVLENEDATHGYDFEEAKSFADHVIGNLIDKTSRIQYPEASTNGSMPIIVLKGQNDEGEIMIEDVKTLEDYLPNPVRKRAKPYFNRANSFVDYLNQHKRPNQTSVYIDDSESNTRLTAVIDDHEVGSDGKAAWRDHQAVFTPEYTDEWNTWTKNDGDKKRQGDFALFIERNVLDIMTPDGAQMLEIARTFEAKKNVNFKSGIRLENGDVSFTFEETTASKAGEKGQFNIPQTITIAVPIFKGGAAYQIEANFRYRIEDGKLWMWYELVRPQKSLEHAINTIVDEIKTKVSDVSFYYGTF